MSGEGKKNGGLWGFFRNRGSLRKLSKSERDRPAFSEPPPPDNELTERVRKEVRFPDGEPTRRRTRRVEAQGTKGKGKSVLDGQPQEWGPLTEWPPSGYSSDEELPLGHAMELISTGVPAFKGHKRPIPHASDHYYAFFATAAGNRGDETDLVNQHDSMTQLMTLTTNGPRLPEYPWMTLEQPSYAFCFGNRPGTITLNHWTSMASIMPPTIALRDAGMPTRPVTLTQIFRRLRHLEGGLEDDNEELMYKNLYKRLLVDPDKGANPHKTLDKQITDLIIALSRPEWIDFTNPRNQVVTKFIFDTGHANHQQYLNFFHQLLLSVELEMRINSKHHNDWAKEKLLSALPPTILWNLALARRWREFVRVEDYGETAEQIRLRFKLLRRQAKMLKRFAQMMKWPNLSETLDTLKRRDADGNLDSISSDALAFFSGLVLPGPSFPFLMMNTLIDMDPDKATDDLALLTHLHPHCGFQYRNSYTYWTSASIIGKVLAPTCHEVAGWVGPARPTVDLGRTQIARVRSHRPRSKQLTPEDIRGMHERSDPLGPPTDIYPVSEYKLVSQDTDEITDTVRIELLSLRPVGPRQSGGNSGAGASGSRVSDLGGPRWFDASIQFALDGVSWPLRLSYDVSFICAWPCTAGPHPLFYDYVFQPAKVDQIVHINGWPPAALGANARRSLSVTSLGPNGLGNGMAKDKGKAPADVGDDNDKVLVIEAFGVKDNEVLARAWCAHWGLSAVVAEMRTTCMACAIREAYAAAVTIVILVDDQANDDVD